MSDACDEKIADVGGIPMYCCRELPCPVHSTRPGRLPDRIVNLPMDTSAAELKPIDPDEPIERTKLYGATSVDIVPPPTSADRARQAFTKLKESIDDLIASRDTLREERDRLQQENTELRQRLEKREDQ